MPNVSLAPGKEKLSRDQLIAGVENGIYIHGYPSVGGLLYSGNTAINSDNAILWCSGTLIGCNTFLVAGHCVDDAVAGHYLVYLQHVGLLPVASITRHPSYLDSSFPLFDVAVLKLATWATGVAPSLVNQTDPAPFVDGADGIIVGFGETEGFMNDYGIKRGGTVQTVNCPTGLPSAATNSDVICWIFSDPIDPPGTDSNTCNGDSGGPIFMDFGSGTVVAGVTSGGTSGNCLPEDDSYDANVYTHRAFILGQLGSDSTAACGVLAPVEDAQTTVTDIKPAPGWVESVRRLHDHGNALAKRCVALNGEDNGLFDIDLREAGTGASSSEPRLRRQRSVCWRMHLPIASGRNVVDRRRARRRIGQISGHGDSVRRRRALVRQRRARVQRGVRWVGRCAVSRAVRHRLHVRAAVFRQRPHRHRGAHHAREVQAPWSAAER
jgi:hypothetical protein